MPSLVGSEMCIRDRVVTRTVDGEMAKIKIPTMSSITLTSADANIPLPVTNETGYRVKATLQFNGNGLTFPKGQNKKVILEPKENMLEIPVRVTKKAVSYTHLRAHETRHDL